MSLSLFDLSGQRALVTDFGQGIGPALARGPWPRPGRPRCSAAATRPSSKPRDGLREAGFSACFYVIDPIAVAEGVAACPSSGYLGHLS